MHFVITVGILHGLNIRCYGYFYFHIICTSCNSIVKKNFITTNLLLYFKVRPNWKPGAANAILVRRYRAQRGEGEDSLKKKKRAMMQRKKKIEMKPTLVVSKRNGEYTVQMEVFKKFSKERLLFQYPYDEKPALMYTVGKTAEEVRKIQRQRDRRERRETRRKSRLLQSSFRDRCQEICLKAYNQAIGVLPLPNPNEPDCPCAGKPIHIPPPTVDSCSCSDDASTIETSDTDNDEWVIEFTPPAAKWVAKAKHPPVMVDSETHYTYLDYKVKVLDKNGNQVPRFFKGPDGKQECSDLGGFWGKIEKHRVWFEINKDGYIGPDNRWVPQNFIGHDGMAYSSDEGCFTDTNGKVWKIGIDGYVDKDGKWAFYCKKKLGSVSKFTKSSVSASTVDGRKGGKSTQDGGAKNNTPKMKIGDCKTKKEATPAPAKKEAQAPTKDNNNNKNKVSQAKSTNPKSNPTNPPPVLKQTKTVETKAPTSDKAKGTVVMPVTTNFERKHLPRTSRVMYKPYMDRKAMARYREIIEELRAYDDIGELKPPPKANRASNTPLSQLSNFTMRPYRSKKMPSLTTDRSYGFGTSTTMSGIDSLLLSKLHTDRTDDDCNTY